ncbi:MAG TPA: hypothetical protein PKE26_04770 [Kiritimatiellia bacterium]|nr:hypothetical protein [Kiritimatiellia bacterium]HMO98403.1 hypothetical protein [Kiritimatiellia bacterium]HMP96456.1 hypothetical protein [Kiritimatiellia bacterium]
MKLLLFIGALLAALPAHALLPFLFTPQAKEIRVVGAGYTVALDNGSLISVDRFGMGYRATMAGREIASYTQQGADWVETPGGRTWTLGTDGKWRASGGDWLLARVISDIVLRQGGSATAWKQEERAWIRK